MILTLFILLFSQISHAKECELHLGWDHGSRAMKVLEGEGLEQLGKNLLISMQ